MRILSGSTKVAFGFGLGVVAAGVVKDILPAFRGLGRPLLKATVKSGLILAEQSRVKLDEFRETLADVAAEAEAELAAEQAAGAAEMPRGPQPVAKAVRQGAGIM